MNETEVTTSAQTWNGHPVLGPASVTLLSLVAAVNSCSDGWPYWRAPSAASRQLQDMIEQANRARWMGTGLPDNGRLAVQLRKAYAQLRRFRTAHPQVAFRIYGAPNAPGDPEPQRPAAPAQHQIRLRVTGRQATVEVTGDTPLAPGRYRGVVVKLNDSMGEVA